MKTTATEMFGIDVPVFAFSHCRDVVVEVSKAGGLGVLGCAYYTPEQLREELSWIERHVEGKPYGVDFLLPGKYQKIENPLLKLSDLPREQTDYMRKYLDDAGIPRLPDDHAEALIADEIAKIQMTREQALALVDVALEFPIKLVVNALGAPPKEMVDRLHAAGVKVGGMIGSVDHAQRHKDAGVDILIAQGMEAGGHTGKITSMVLWSQVVDAVAPIPVLAAGGVGRGRHMAAALALGAEGIWCGSIWLTTKESELIPEVKARLLGARSEDAIQSRSRTGKPARILDSKLVQAWSAPGAPDFLPMPLQTAAMAESRLRVERARASEWLSPPAGQIVGDMNRELTVKQVVYEILDEFVDSVDRINRLVAAE